MENFHWAWRNYVIFIDFIDIQYEILKFRFFFDIFFAQKTEYGINYKEINKLLMNKRIYEREYLEYKKVQNDLYMSLVEDNNTFFNYLLILIVINIDKKVI